MDCDVCDDGIFTLRARKGHPQLEMPCPYCGAGASPAHAAYPLVVVEWEDASNVATWTDTDEAYAFENIDFDYHCTNVGYLIRDDETCVIVAARADGGFKQVGLIERIPRGMVLAVRRLDQRMTGGTDGA